MAYERSTLTSAVDGTELASFARDEVTQDVLAWLAQHTPVA